MTYGQVQSAQGEHSIQSRQTYNQGYYDRNGNPLQNGRFNSSQGAGNNYPYTGGTAGDGGNSYIVKPMGLGPGPIINPYPPGMTLNGTQLPPIGGPIPAGSPHENAVSVRVQLKGYTNPQLRLDQTRTCSCPQGSSRCMDMSPQRLGSSVQYQATPFIPLTENGNPSDPQDFQKSFDFLLSNQPMAIDIFVHHLGAVIDARTGELEQPNTVYHVDTFVQPLNGTTSSIQTGNMQQATLTGQLLGTQLSLAYTISCRGKLIGPGCDLQCNTSSVHTSTALCQSQKTGYFSLCKWALGNSQVTDCQNCPWGISENAFCRDESGGVLEAHHAVRWYPQMH
ncbi:PQN-89 protein [Aphelenchoides avenae]|nr:PQN-89 protein [Aphelenchus avenae]